LGAVVAGEQARGLPGLQGAEERRFHAGLEVVGRAHAAIEQFEEEDGGEPEEHADEESPARG
jgi:hypothetical protein